MKNLCQSKYSINASSEYVWTPSTYEGQRPLLVWLHPAGGCPHSMRKYHKYLFKEYPYNICGISSGNDIFRPYNVLCALEDCLEKYSDKINQQKIHMTGFSMGARGVWDFVLEFPEIIKSFSVVAGYGCYLRSHRLTNKDIFIIHSKNDEVVPFEESVKMLQSLYETNNVQFDYGYNDSHGKTSAVYLRKEFYTNAFK